MVNPRVLWFVLALSILWCMSFPGRAQSPATPAFEVASVKRNNSGPNDTVWITSEAGGILRLINNPLSNIIRLAWGVSEDQIVGPEWIHTTRFDVLAKTESNFRPNIGDGPLSIRPMLQALLAERFKLAAHHETRPVPKYALVIARADGTPDNRVKRSTTDCEPILAERTAQQISRQVLGEPCTLRRAGNRLVADSSPLSALAGFLGPFPGYELVDRGVVDRTNLTGMFSFTLDLDPSVSIFTALQEQLGLKLQPAIVPSDVIVIDHVEQLIEN